MSGESQRVLSSDEVIGGYELLRRLGKGAMTEVWLARRVGGRAKHVALKVILPQLAGQARYSRMFLAEAEQSSMLSHSNIVQVFDEGEDNGVSYLVMEWVDGINLVRLREAMKLIDDPQLRASIAAFVVGQLLHALSYAHSITAGDGTALGIVHRDVSPQNVLVSTSGDVKLADFGVAPTVGEESSGMHVKGKLRYMAPDQLAGNTRSPGIDIYGAGAILTELLDGCKFRGDFDDDRKLHAQVFSGQLPALASPCAPELERVRSGLLHPDPAQRLGSAEQALAMLREYAGYRDMRLELSKICGSLTGVVRPRTGPAARAETPGPEIASSPEAAPLAPAPAAPAAVEASLPSQPHAVEPAPEGTVMLPGGGHPGRDGGSAAADLPPNEPTAFLPSSGLPPGASPVAAADLPASAPDATALVQPHFGAPASAKPPSAGQLAPKPMSTPRAVDPGAPAADDHSMTRFAVEQGGGKSIALIFGIGVFFALSGAGVVAYLLVGDAPAKAEEKIAAPAKTDAPKPSASATPAAPPSDELVIGGAEAAPSDEPPAAGPPPEPETPTPADAPVVPPPVQQAPPPEPQSAVPEKPPARAGSGARAGSKRPKLPKVKSVIVHLRKQGVAEAWVKVAGRSTKISSGSNLKIKAGRHAVKTRNAKSAPYKSCGKHNFEAGKEWKLYVSASGCRVQSF